MEQIKILHVLSSLKKNGTETFLMNVFRNIDSNFFKFDFLVFNDNKDGFYNEIISKGSKIYFLPPRNKGFINYHKNLNAFFQRHATEYDVIHLHDMSLSSVAPLYFAKKNGISKRIIHIHGANTTGLHNKILHKINRLRISRLANYGLSCSKEASKWGYTTSSLYKKSIVIPNGIDLEKFVFDKDARKEIRANLGIKDNELTLIHIGNFNTIKNQKFIIDVVKILKQRSLPIKLLLVGTGVLLESNKQYVELNRLSENVIFLGYRDDVPALMSAADILVFPSFHEGLGLVVVEAQASGLTAFVSTGIPEEVAVSNLVHRYNLSLGPDFWANEITEIETNSEFRCPPKEINNYAIQKTVTLLSQIYTE